MCGQGASCGGTAVGPCEKCGKETTSTGTPGASHLCPDCRPKPEGWGKPLQAKKWHYFIGGRSLCGGWGWFASDNLQKHDGTYGETDCAACTKRLKAREVKD